VAPVADGALSDTRCFQHVTETCSLDPASATDEQRMEWLSALIAPRPVLVAVTLDPNGRPRAAPFSSVLPLGIAPMSFALGIHPRHDGGVKTTLRNAEASRELTVQTVTPEMLEAVVRLGDPRGGVDAPPQGELLASWSVRPPRWARAPVQMECRVVEIAHLRSSPLTLLAVEVIEIHVARSLCDQQGVVPARLIFAGHLDVLPPSEHAFLVGRRWRAGDGAARLYLGGSPAPSGTTRPSEDAPK
jgi:flavin reductase (DIM6/NTAB) family NADH-FMN oxidoreductase RutF